MFYHREHGVSQRKTIKTAAVQQIAAAHSPFSGKMSEGQRGALEIILIKKSPQRKTFNHEKRLKYISKKYKEKLF